MIVPMKKILLLALADEIESVLADLRDVGVVDIARRDMKPSATSATAESAANRISGILSKLRTRAAERRIAQSASGTDAAAVADGAEKAYAELAELRAAISRDTMRLEELSAWGEFSRSSISRLAAHGVRVTLCVGSEADFERAEALDGVCVRRLGQQKRGQVRFVVIGMSRPPADANLPVFRLSVTDDPATLRAGVEKMTNDAEELERRLDGFAADRVSLERLSKRLVSELEFCLARDSFERHRDIIVLEGFVPEPALDDLRAAASGHGWGLSIDDPDDDDEVPVLVKKNRFSKLIDPLFDFLGILPGYRELDVSGAVMVFFTVFYAMIIGDFGYGLLFLAASAVASVLFKGRPAAKVPIRLSWILGVATVAWGALCGNFFGTSLGGVKCLTESGVRDATVQAFCFTLAVAQLTIGHVLAAMRTRSWRSFGANLGWTLVIWGNFLLAMRLIVWPGGFPVAMYWLYGCGLGLVVAFGVDWRNVADVFQLPFSVIGSFSDLLSYIRLFAVGMAGSCIAQSFNDMAVDVVKSSPWFILAGIAIVLFGHLLNLAMGFLGVMVHGVRLNTLEFSNHVGLTWSGVKYHPFAKDKDENKEEEQSK